MNGVVRSFETHRILKDNISICSDTARRSAFDTNQTYFLYISTRYVELFIESILVQELRYETLSRGVSHQESKL